MRGLTMLKLKPIVKVMNFRSLINIESAMREAQKYFETEQELRVMMSKIIYNSNFILDKKNLKVDESKPVLNIYVGNDYGFCGNFNVLLNKDINNSTEDYKILIGRKTVNTANNVLLKIEKNHFDDEFSKIKKVITERISESKYSEVNIVYNRYYNYNDLRFTKRKIYPLENKKYEDVNYSHDYIVETDIDNFLKNLTVLYIMYELRIRKKNSDAAENVMRQKMTTISLKKIEEMEEESKALINKEKKEEKFKESLELYRNFS